MTPWDSIKHALETEKKVKNQPFGGIGSEGWEMRITVNSDIRIMGSDGVWQNTIALSNLPWVLGRLNAESAGDLARDLQRVIDNYERKLRVLE